jgi:hypothetical protein
LTFRASLLVLVGIASVLFTWRRLLGPEVKAPVVEYLAAAWCRTTPMTSRAVTDP